MKRVLYPFITSAIAWAAALPLGTQALAQQTGIIPPLTRQQVEEKRRENVNDTVFQGATALPGMILEGGKILTQDVDPSAVRHMSEAVEMGSGIISYSVTGAKILGATAQDGFEGFKRESSQALMEKGAELGGQAATSYLINRAVGSGIALGTASGAAGIAYSAGSVFGTYLRNNVDLGQSIGLRASIGDEVDNAWFAVSPDKVKEWASGTKQVNIDDPAVLQQMQDAASRNRRQAAFDHVQRENLAQQQQMQDAATAAATSVQMTGELSGPPSERSGLDATTLSILSILNASNAAHPPRQSLAIPSDRAAASSRACKLDPKTGCHPGHDEKSHPGGCKVC